MLMKRLGWPLDLTDDKRTYPLMVAYGALGE